MNASETKRLPVKHVHGPQHGRGALFVGYGNTLRSDDGVGPAVVLRLAKQFKGNAQCLFLALQQLSPELALDLCAADRVIFIDASTTLPPGKVRVRRLGSGESSASCMFHNSSPETVLGLTRSLYERAPEAWLVAIGVADLSLGDGLSARVRAGADRLVRHLGSCVARWSGTWASPARDKEDSHVIS